MFLVVLMHFMEFWICCIEIEIGRGDGILELINMDLKASPKSLASYFMLECICYVCEAGVFMMEIYLVLSV